MAQNPLKSYSKTQIQRSIAIQKARLSLRHYLPLYCPPLFTPDKYVLYELADLLQAFHQNELYNRNGQLCNGFAMHLPPRIGKSLTIQAYVSWVLGKGWMEWQQDLADDSIPFEQKRKEKRIIYTTYGSDLSKRFSSKVLSYFKNQKKRPDWIPSSEIFGGCKLSPDSTAKEMWSLDQTHESFLAYGYNGSITGSGGDEVVVDDIIKNAYEASNDRVLNEHEETFWDTLHSRSESGKFLLNFTRWATGDLAGRTKKIEKEQGDDPEIAWYTYSRSVEERGKLIFPWMYDEKKVRHLKRRNTPVVRANYWQEPIDIKGALYQNFQSYQQEDLDELRDEHGFFTCPVRCRIDTANQGADFLSAIFYVHDEKNGLMYILDTIYTQDKMQLTEPRVAQMLKDYRANTCIVEANNGGEGFARAVKKIMIDDLQWHHTSVRDVMTTSKRQKLAAIRANASVVEDTVRFPAEYQGDNRFEYEDFVGDLSCFQGDGSDSHDDGPDNLTAMVEDARVDSEGGTITQWNPWG